MKKQIFKKALFVCLTLIGITSCKNSPPTEAEKENMGESELRQAREDSVNALSLYKSECESKFKENDQKIAELKEKMKGEKKEVQAKYQKELDELETKNASLRSNVNECTETDKTKVETLKDKYNTEIEALGVAIAEFKEKNFKKK